MLNLGQEVIIFFCHTDTIIHICWNERKGKRKKNEWKERSVCLAKQGQPLVHCPSFIDKGPGKCAGKKKKLMKLSTLLN